MRRILVADDDPAFCFLARVSLAAAGFGIDTVADGVEALELMKVKHFDAALVDLSMPRIDGFRLIGLIRGMPRYSTLPIMVVTVHKDEAFEQEAYRLGVKAFHRKPVDWSRLARMLRAELAPPTPAGAANATE